MNNGMTGFNPELVTQTIRGVQAAYEETVNTFFDVMQNRFVNRMAEIWACNVAVDFFNNVVKELVDRVINGVAGDPHGDGITTIFNSIVESINSCAQEWAIQTQSEYQFQSLSSIVKNLDVQNVRENINGIRGIDLQSVPGVTSQLNEILGATTTALNKTVDAVRNSGFVGGSQEANLINSINEIRANIVNAVEFINSECQLKVKNTVEQYENTAGRIAQAFAGQQ